jgi:hypothetical protein
MDNQRAARGVSWAGRFMGSIIKSIGHGLLAAGILLIILYVIGAYLRGSEAFRDALDPTAMKTYLALVPLAPGLMLLWLADRLVTRRRT